MTRQHWNYFTQDLSRWWRSSSRVSYVNFISGSSSLSLSLSLSFLYLSRIFPLPIALSFNNRPLDDFVTPQIANIVRTSANPNQRRQSRRCSINVASRVSPSLSMHRARLWLVHTTLASRELSFCTVHFISTGIAKFGP